MSTTVSEARKILAKFRGLPTSAHKQIGVRAAKAAIQFADSNPAHACAELSQARFELPMAQIAAAAKMRVVDRLLRDVRDPADASEVWS